jgi:cation transport regulator ChaB
MPKSDESNAGRDDLPSTLQRSPEDAQEQFLATLDSAIDQYGGDGERARRTAYASLKHDFEKVGDHWERKSSPGPSDERAEKGGAAARRGEGETKGGVDANASKEHLLGLARRLDIHGRSAMTKEELVNAIAKANDRKTAQARKG